MRQRLSVETPVGEIVSRFNGQDANPGLELRIVTPDNPDGVVVAAVEWDKADERLAIMHWRTVANDDTDPHVTRLKKYDVLRQIAKNASK